MKSREQYEAELKRLIDRKNELEKIVKKVERENYDKWIVEIRKYKRAEREYAKLLDEYITKYSKT